MDQLHTTSNGGVLEDFGNISKACFVQMSVALIEVSKNIPFTHAMYIRYIRKYFRGMIRTVDYTDEIVLRNKIRADCFLRFSSPLK